MKAALTFRGRRITYHNIPSARTSPTCVWCGAAAGEGHGPACRRSLTLRAAVARMAAAELVDAEIVASAALARWCSKVARVTRGLLPPPGIGAPGRAAIFYRTAARRRVWELRTAANAAIRRAERIEAEIAALPGPRIEAQIAALPRKARGLRVVG